MTSRHRFHAANVEHFGSAPESRDREIRAMWRELARPVTFFDLCSPQDLLVGEIGELFRKKRARQDSNLRPPA
jgi:hypothetical protein